MGGNEVGVITGLHADHSNLAGIRDMGLKVCQFNVWNQGPWCDEAVRNYPAASRKYGVKATSLWVGWPGPAVWDFVKGPETLGIVPRRYRAMRVRVLKTGAELAARLGLPAIITHLGFIPENPTDPMFGEVVKAVREIALHCKRRGIGFWFETGQETPVTVLRLIETVGTGNLGVNLDPANLILYGKANPIDALDVFGKHVKCVHAKDGMYPTHPMYLGHEVKVGTGKVRFPEFVKRLREVGFKGDYIIEREISGEQQKKDIADTVKYLRKLIAR
jgi:sugar phosphate isomerase/epimerase